MASSLPPRGDVVSSSAAEIRELVGRVADPEIPVLTLEDLGILRDVSVGADGHVVVELTPTLSRLSGDRPDPRAGGCRNS